MHCGSDAADLQAEHVRRNNVVFYLIVLSIQGDDSGSRSGVAHGEASESRVRRRKMDLAADDGLGVAHEAGIVGIYVRVRATERERFANQDVLREGAGCDTHGAPGVGHVDAVLNKRTGSHVDGKVAALAKQCGARGKRDRRVKIDRRRTQS